MTENSMCFCVLSTQRLQLKTSANDLAHTPHIFHSSPESNALQTPQKLKCTQTFQRITCTIEMCGSSDERLRRERP